MIASISTLWGKFYVEIRRFVQQINGADLPACGLCFNSQSEKCTQGSVSSVLASPIHQKPFLACPTSHWLPAYRPDLWFAETNTNSFPCKCLAADHYFPRHTFPLTKTAPYSHEAEECHQLHSFKEISDLLQKTFESVVYRKCTSGHYRS